MVMLQEQQDQVMQMLTQTSMKASYAYGPVTVAYSDHEHDVIKLWYKRPRRYII